MMQLQGKFGSLLCVFLLTGVVFGTAASPCAVAQQSDFEKTLGMERIAVYESEMARAHAAFLSADYETAKVQYEAILERRPDDARALIGLARVLQRIKRVSGVEPPELKEVMKKVRNAVDKVAGGDQEVKKAIFETIDESPEMQRKKEEFSKEMNSVGATGIVRKYQTEQTYGYVRQSVKEAEKVLQDSRRWNFSNRDSGTARSRHWQPGSDGRLEKSARQNLEEHYSRSSEESLPEVTPALLFRRDCPEPEFKRWYFLDPPA